MGIAGPEDSVVSEIDVEFLLQSGFNIDFGEDAETLFFQLLGHH